MSTDIKHQVMAKLLDIHPAAWEKAAEQASEIIEIVRYEEGLCTKPGLLAFQKATADKILDDLNESAPESLKVQATEFTAEDLSYLKDRGHTWAEIAAETGITPDAARKRVMKWRAKQPAQMTPPINGISPEMIVYEPGAEEARQEAEAAEATIRNSLTVEPANHDIDTRIKQLQSEGIGTKQIQKLIKREFQQDLSLNDIRANAFIQKRIAAGDMDIEILQAVKRNFPGISMDVADIRSRRRKA